jgi:hypothetical protein
MAKRLAVLTVVASAVVAFALVQVFAPERVAALLRALAPF